MMFEDLPNYHGVGFFGENIFDPDAAEPMDEDELRALYPETTDRLDI